MTDGSKPLRIINIPRTSTILALGVLTGGIISGSIDWNTALLMILTFYFTKDQNRQGAQP